MPVYKMEETKTFETLPPDTMIQVEVEDVTEKWVEGKNGNEGWAKLEFKFLIRGVPTQLEDQYGDLVGSRIWGSVSAKFTDHPNNKLRQWSEALLGSSVNQPGFELDTDVLIGRKCRAATTQYKRQDGTFNHQIGSLYEAIGTASATVIAAPVPAAEPTPSEPVLAMTLDDEPPF